MRILYTGQGAVCFPSIDIGEWQPDTVKDVADDAAEMLLRRPDMQKAPDEKAEPAAEPVTAAAVDMTSEDTASKGRARGAKED